MFNSKLCARPWATLLLSLLLPTLAFTQEQQDQPEQWTDVIKMVDVDKHTVAGSWQVTDGSLTTNAENGSRAVLPIQPGTEYDFRVRFTRKSGANSIALVFVVAGRQVTFDIDGWSEHLSGIQQIGGRDMRAYRDEVASVTLQNGKEYTALVQVRKAKVSVFLDDQLLHAHETDGSDLSLLDLWRLPETKSLGLGAWNSATTFHAIEFRNVSGDAKLASVKQGLPKGTAPQTSVPDETNKADDIAELSDEFDDAKTLKNWLRVFEVEKSGADQLERIDIGRTQEGWLAMVPRTSTWYRDYRGVLGHKRVKGDFVVTTRVHTSGRDGRGAPGSQFSLAGIMVRTPRDVTPQTWRAGGENYIFLSHGAANRPGSYQLEVKTTINSDSQLEIIDTQHAEAEIRVARLGEHFILLRREPEGNWLVHRRYHRPDMPAELQVGMTVYTDYPNASRIDAAQHNRTAIRDGQPDLRAGFEYFRFRRPEIPAELRDRALSDPSQASDEVLLQFLGRKE
jgi:hypothetical protein